MYKTGRFLLICLLALMSTVISAQKNVYSPFARYGIGIIGQEGTFRTRAMGGISSGIRNSLTLNFPTPASYSSIDTASFIFDFGLDYTGNMLKNADLTYYSQDLTFSHLIMGFPVIKGLGVVVGIIPYSNGAYNIADETDAGSVAGDILESHKGYGGYHKALLGAGYSPIQHVSAGVNMFFVFGEENRINDFTFISDENYFNTRKHGSIAMNGIGYEVSLQLMAPLPANWHINAGLTYTPGFNLKTTTEEFIFRYSSVQTSALAFDTLYQDTGSITSRLPRTIRAGLSVGQNDKFTAGADIVYTKWTEASLPGTYGIYRDALAFHAGAEYIPDLYSNYGFFNRVEYRIGCRYGESYTLFDGDVVNEYGITFGAGLPLRRSRSRISVYFDLSNRGNLDDNLFRETRLSIGASLNLFDYWFLKAKYE
jgi:hypothetical protein